MSPLTRHEEFFCDFFLPRGNMLRSNFSLAEIAHDRFTRIMAKTS